MKPVHRPRLSLASQILVFQLAIVLGALLIGAAASYLNESRQLDKRYEDRSLTIAQSVAGMPSVGDGLRDSDPARTLQPLAEGIRNASGARFVVIAGANGIRYSHPNPAMIGKHIDEDFHTVLAGHTWIGVENGTLGKSARGKAPIFDGQNRVIGIVSVGFLEGTISNQLAAMLPQLAFYVLVALVVGVAGSLLLAQRLKRQTFGLEPEEIATLLEQREASLHGIREGTIATDKDGRITLINDEARRLLRLLDNARSVTEALRAQAHDFSNRLHTIAGLIELGRQEEAIQLTTESSSVSQELTESLLERVGDPVLGALLLGKSAVAAERGIQFRLSPDSRLDGDAGHPRDLITVVGNLIDNALDAAAIASNGGPRWVEVSIHKADGDVVIQVHDSGPGIGNGDLGLIFSEGYTTKVAGPGSRRGLGLALVQQVAARRGGEVTVVNRGGALFTVRLPLFTKPVSVGRS